MNLTTLAIGAFLIAVAVYFLPKNIYQRTEFAVFLAALFFVVLGFAQPTVLLFLAVLFVLILVHEWGHFIVAKKTGMRVDEFGIGLPPKLFGWKKGETEYTLNALPIGGFVRILGENYDGETDEMVVADKARTFGARPKWAQALVLIAGVAMNVLFAWCLFVAVFAIGVPQAVDEATASESAKLVVSGVLPEAPAAQANLPLGAEIIAVGDSTTRLAAPTPSEFTDFVSQRDGVPLTVEYLYADNQEQVIVTPTRNALVDSDTPAIGVAITYTEVVRTPLPQAVIDGAKTTWVSLVAVTKGLLGFFGGLAAGTASLNDVAGPVGLVGLVGTAAEFGFTSLLLFTAMISLNLAVINMLPIPALDGGRLLFVAIEALTKKDIPAVWAARVNFVGFALLMLLMLAVTASDVLKLL